MLPNDLRIMFESWTKVRLRGSQSKAWSLLFFVVIWSIWNLRNKVIFEKGEVRCNNGRHKTKMDELD